MPGEIGQRAEGDVHVVVERAGPAAVPPPRLGQRAAAEHGNVPVAGADIPPAHPELVEVRGLQHRGKQHQPGLVQMRHDVADPGNRVRHVLERLEAGDEVEFARRRAGEVRDKRIVGHGDRKPCRAQMRAKGVVAAAIVEHAPLAFVRTEQHGRRIIAWPGLGIFRIDRRITVIIDVRPEVGLAPAIEGVGEQKTAGAATPVAHRRAGGRQFHAALDLAISVEVDGPVKR